MFGHGAQLKTQHMLLTYKMFIGLSIGTKSDDFKVWMILNRVMTLLILHFFCTISRKATEAVALREINITLNPHVCLRQKHSPRILSFGIAKAKARFYQKLTGVSVFIAYRYISIDTVYLRKRHFFAKQTKLWSTSASVSPPEKQMDRYRKVLKHLLKITSLFWMCLKIELVNFLDECFVVTSKFVLPFSFKRRPLPACIAVAML